MIMLDIRMSPREPWPPRGSQLSQGSGQLSQRFEVALSRRCNDRLPYVFSLYPCLSVFIRGVRYEVARYY